MTTVTLDFCGRPEIVTLLKRVTEAEIVQLYAECTPVPLGAPPGPRLYAVRRDGCSIIFWPAPIADWDFLFARPSGVHGKAAS